MKKDMIGLVHENHDKWPNITPVQHCPTSCKFFPYMVPNIYQKLDSVMCIFFNMST